jgi:hypothetical protein
MPVLIVNPEFTGIVISGIISENTREEIRKILLKIRILCWRRKKWKNPYNTTRLIVDLIMYAIISF